MWAAMEFFLWIFYFAIAEGECDKMFMLLSLVSLAGIYANISTIGLYITRFVEGILGLGIVVIFAMMDFECGICASSESRQFSNAANNTRILRFFIMGCVAILIEIILFFVLRCYGKINFNG